MPLRAHPSLPAVLLLLSLCPIAHAAPPRGIPFQAVLKDASGHPLNASVPVTFTLYDAPAGGTTLWSETKTVAGTSGVFATVLGDTNPFPPSLAFDRPYWVGVTVGSDPEMAGRLPLQSVPYALALPGITPDPTGRDVGIGTTIPGALLDVVAHPTVPGGQVLDQQQLKTGTFGLAMPGYNLNQSFVAGQTGKLTRIDLYCQGYNGTTFGLAFTGTISLYAGVTVHGTPLGMYNISGPVNPVTWREFDFSPGFDVTAGSVYTWQVIPTGANGIRIALGPNDPYPYGAPFVDAAGTNSYDFAFQTYVTVPAGPAPVHALTVRDDTGSVGINTVNPSAGLEVRGTDARLSNAQGHGGIKLTSDATSGAGLLTTVDGSDRMKVAIGTAGTGTGLGGSVGVADYLGNIVASLYADRLGRGAFLGDEVHFPNQTGDKVFLWGTDPNSYYGLSVQNNLLQVHADLQGSDVAFGYGGSAAFHETMRVKGSGNVGIGTSAPVAKLDVRGSIAMGASADMWAPGGAENLYLVRGIINGDGTINRGAGFTSTHKSAGRYTITFTDPNFVQPPAIAVTPWSSQPLIAVVPYILGQAGGATFDVQLYLNGSPTDSGFTFIATANR